LTRFAAVFVFLFSFSAFAQDSLAPQTISELKLLQKAALNSDYAYRQTSFLSDNIGPRPAGSAAYARATEYVGAELRKLGIEVTFEDVQVEPWIRGEESAHLVRWPGMTPNSTQKLVVTALGGSPTTSQDGITAEIVVVNNFDELHALGREQVQGKIVVFNHKFDRRKAEGGLPGDAYGAAVAYRSRGALEAAKLGAVASLIRSAGGAEYRLAHTGGMNTEQGAIVPAGALAAEDAALLARLSEQGPVRMNLVLLSSSQAHKVKEHNVIADIKGTEHPEQIVIVSGHLDSWDLGTGALDDAVGVGIAMEVANLVKQLGLKPKRTIRVIAWSNEEHGLDGGITYAKTHQKEIANHVAAIEADFGTGHPYGINIEADPIAVDLLKPVSKVLESQGAGILRPSEDSGADLIPLTVLGVPCFAPLQDGRTYFDYHHTAADTFDKIDLAQLRENSAVVAVLAYALANLERPIPHKSQPTPEWLKSRLAMR
jgi:carboxypeptidase Q